MMRNEKLSPDEMNGLLGRAITQKNNNSPVLDSLTQTEREVLLELFSVSLGSASPVLSELLADQVLITAPGVTVKRTDDLFRETSAPFFIVLSEYVGLFEGIQMLTVDEAGGQAVIDIAEGEPEELETQLEAVQTLVKNLFDAAARSMSALLEQQVDHSLSGVDKVNERQDFQVTNFTQEEWFAEIDFQLKAGSQKNLNFRVAIPVRLAKQFVEELDDSAKEEEQEETQEMPFQSDNSPKESNPLQKTGGSPNVQSVQFSSFDDEEPNQSEPNNLNMLLDIPLQVTVELGRTKRMVKEILGISQGSIIELDKLAGEPVDILVNNKLIAVGEVVVIDENFGVRVTDILSAADRISKLR